jgi:hypothetical protein
LAAALIFRCRRIGELAMSYSVRSSGFPVLSFLGVVQNACFLRYTDELIRPAFSGWINTECESV